MRFVLLASGQLFNEYVTFDGSTPVPAWLIAYFVKMRVARIVAAKRIACFRSSFM